MEVGEGGEEKQTPPRPAADAWKKPPPEGGEKPPKRKMKTPYQLEILEKTYAVETYPSETLRGELSAKTGLSDRQLQMWFCHRRLKDRKFPPTKRQRKEEESLPLTPPPPVLPPQSEIVSSESGCVGALSASPFSAGLGSSGESRRPVSRTAVLSRIGTDMSAVGRRYYDPQGLPPPPQTHLTIAELRILESVESQLGEPLRQDGPVLGIEFDPLPPGAFGAPIAELPIQQKQPMRPYDSIMFERHDTKTGKAASFLPGMDHLLPSSSSAKRKTAAGGSHMVHPHMGSRALHEYQFLPEQPTVRSEAYDRVSQSHYYDSSIDTSSARIHSGVKSLHGNDQEAPGYTFQGQMSSASHLSQQGRQQNFPSVSMDPDGGNSFPVPANDAQFGMHEGIGIENPYLSSDRRLQHDEDPSRLERKRKSDEARIAKEVEAHEKRIRKELEKQDILRRKREEQMRKEMERHDRERKKEEERAMREKQREEERFQREQQRENQRREKFLLKESRRAEKLRQKEELRREKEAARQKAATERATARRIAREYMELIEDERLELMELAAANRGFPSIFALDSDTLQQLDSFRSMLCSFPPTSVRLRRPFAIRPWADSDENIANLLMVWKFLITFADVLGLWPFTLDEFVQSLHDYDSRLLGEIHVSLLKSIIKNIEDVARTPATTIGASQSSSANPGGGHPRIVEGAYAWGFNIRSWQHHLNYLTWPEILRQFALSAGFGPQLKKRNAERVHFRDENEGNDGEDVISTLRNGSAVENAVALMQERGYSNRRRSRHRLTPGTVKFAAFHVLSLEGSKGLTILQVADKIQKSGLRDLTTSKTPEASIAAALSRDSKLFERTAPSTYCVRSPYRKDPADADAVLSAAREKIQVFQNALSDSEEAEKDTEEVDDAERDEDSEGDVADDPEVEDAGIDAKLDKNDPFASELKDSQTLVSLGKEKEEETGLAPRNTFGNTEKALPVHFSENSKAASISGAAHLPDTSLSCHEAGSGNMEETEIDECNFGQPWVQGLSESDYTELSVEERLNALVALVGVAIEGNSIRVILEERLEAASALKKQMWAEAQLDKRRFKEEYPSRLQGTTSSGYKPEIAQTNGMREGSQTPLDNVNKGNDGNPEACNNEHFLEQNQVNLTNAPTGHELTSSDILPVQQYGYASEKSRSQLKSFIGHKAEQLYVYRSLPLGQDRRRNRYWQFSTSSSPNDPGSGRIFFESKDGHWRLIDSEEAFDSLLASLDTRGTRESHLHSMLQRIEPAFKEAIRRNNMCMTSTKSVGDNIKRVSKVMPTPDCSVELDSPSSTLCGLASDALENSTSFRIELGRNEIEKNAALDRYQGFLRWMWNECYSPHVLSAKKYGKKRCSELLHTCKSCFQSFLAEERHCSFCHRTFKTFQTSDAVFAEHISLCEQKRKSDPDCKLQFSDSTLPIGIRLLKAHLSIVEASVPAEALQAFWTEGYRKSWAVKLHSSSSAEELFQILTLLEGAIKKDFLSSNFETTAELLSSTRGIILDTVPAHSGSVPVLPWVPDTLAAVGLRLLDLDASISYMLNQKVESRKEREGDYIKLPSGYAVTNNTLEVEPMGTPDQLDYQNEGRWLDSGSGQRGRGRGNRGGRGGRGRGRGGRRLKGSGSSSRADLMNENLGVFEKAPRKYSRRGGRTRGRGGTGGRRRGRRTVRSRQRSENRVPTIGKRSLMGSFITPDSITTKQTRVESSSPESSSGEEEEEEEWGIGAAGKAYVEDDDNSGGFESEENGQASGDDYDDQAADSARDDYEEGSKPTGFVDDDESEEEEVDGRYMEAEEDGEEEDDIVAAGGHGMGAYMDDDDYEGIRDDEEMRDNADEIGDGDGEGDGEDIGEAEGNGVEDEGASSQSSSSSSSSSYSSEYSD